MWQSEAAEAVEGEVSMQEELPPWRRWMDRHPGIVGAISGGIASVAVGLMWKAVEKWLGP